MPNYVAKSTGLVLKSVVTDVMIWNTYSKLSGAGNSGGAVSADPAERRGNALASLRALCESSVLQPFLMQLLTAKWVYRLLNTLSFQYEMYPEH